MLTLHFILTLLQLVAAQDFGSFQLKSSLTSYGNGLLDQTAFVPGGDIPDVVTTSLNRETVSSSTDTPQKATLVSSNSADTPSTSSSTPTSSSKTIAHSTSTITSFDTVTVPYVPETFMNTTFTASDGIITKIFVETTTSTSVQTINNCNNTGCTWTPRWPFHNQPTVPTANITQVPPTRQDKPASSTSAPSLTSSTLPASSTSKTNCGGCGFDLDLGPKKLELKLDNYLDSDAPVELLIIARNSQNYSANIGYNVPLCGRNKERHYKLGYNYESSVPMLINKDGTAGGKATTLPWATGTTYQAKPTGTATVTKTTTEKATVTIAPLDDYGQAINYKCEKVGSSNNLLCVVNSASKTNNGGHLTPSKLVTSLAVFFGILLCI